jgi:hypothetical protein
MRGVRLTASWPVQRIRPDLPMGLHVPLPAGSPLCQSANMERPLSENELAVLRKMTAVDRPEAAEIRESLGFLVVDEECDCGCGSFGVRDTRFPEQDHHLQSWVDATSTDGETTLGLLLGSDGRLKYLDIYIPNQGQLPKADDLVVLP